MENKTVYIVSCSGAYNTGKYPDEVVRLLMAEVMQKCSEQKRL